MALDILLLISAVIGLGIIPSIAITRWLWRNRIRGWRDTWRTGANRYRSSTRRYSVVVAIQNEQTARALDSKADAAQHFLEWYFAESDERLDPNPPDEHEEVET